MRSLAFLAVALAAPAAADDVVITSTSSLTVGAVDVGFVDGFAAPGGHFDLGVSFENVRVQGEVDIGSWFTDEVPDEQAMAGSHRRVGWGLRYYWMNLDVKHPGKQAPQRLRLYVEGGMGRHRITAKHAADGPSLDIARNDIAIGFGMAQEADVGALLLGGHWGIRAQIAEAPAPNALYTACRGSCDTPSYRKHDIAVFMMIGLAIGR